MKAYSLIVLILFLFFQPASGEKRYVGSIKCKECHSEEYQRFIKYSKKANSYKHIALMRKGLTDEEFRSCLICHTTGYKQPGGFVSLTETPDLKNNGCECCHGPGGDHVESQDPSDIKSELSLDDCKKCHNSERVESFNYKPLKYGGAH